MKKDLKVSQKERKKERKESVELRAADQKQDNEDQGAVFTPRDPLTRRWDRDAEAQREVRGSPDAGERVRANHKNRSYPF